MHRISLLRLSLGLVCLFACGNSAEVPRDPAPEVPSVTEEYVLAQLAPGIGKHGEVLWPKDSTTDTVTFTYRIVPRRTGREGAWIVEEGDRVRGVVLLPPQSDHRGRLSPLSGSVILGARLVAPEGWTAERLVWMGGEVIWYRTESRSLPPGGAEFGLEIRKGDGWPSSSSTYTCAVALTSDGELPTAEDGSPAALHNLVGPGRDSNVVWFWFRQEREEPEDGISDPPPVSLPIGERR